MHDNLYWSPVEGAKEAGIFYKGSNWAEWIEDGQDINSQWSDPLLDFETFQLDPASPAYGMGIKQIDVDSIGILKPIKYWKN